MVELKIVENKGFKNINLKEKKTVDAAGVKVQVPILAGNSIVVEKVFPEGREVKGKFGTSYSCRVMYQNEEVSFFLSPIQHDAYKVLGGVGDKIKITGELVDGSKGQYLNLTFEKQ